MNTAEWKRMWKESISVRKRKGIRQAEEKGEEWKEKRKKI